MAEFDYSKAAQAQDEWLTRKPEVRCAVLKPIVSSFSANMTRLIAMWGLPLSLIGITTIFGKSFFYAVHEIKGKARLSDEEHAKYAPMIGPRVHQIMIEETLKSTDPKQMHLTLASLHSHMIYPPVSEGIYGLLSAMQIGAWTAFETFAEDLWEAAINACPQTLGLMAIQEVEKTKDEDEPWSTSTKRGRQTVSIPFDHLRERGFNLSTSLGTALKSRYTFTGLDQLYKSYVDIWKKKNAELRSIFYDPDLIALSSVRNILIHAGGKFDEEFVRKVKSHALFASAKIGENLPMNPEITGCCISASSNQAKAILKFVDDWIATNIKDKS